MAKKQIEHIRITAGRHAGKTLMFAQTGRGVEVGVSDDPGTRILVRKVKSKKITLQDGTRINIPVNDEWWVGDEYLLDPVTGKFFCKGTIQLGMNARDAFLNTFNIVW